MPLSKWAAAALVLFCAANANAAEIRIVPADFIVLNPTNPDRGYYDLMVHAIAVATGAAEHVQLQSLQVDILSKGQVLLSRIVTADEMAAASQSLASAPIADFVNGQLLNAKGLSGVFGRAVAFGNSAALDASQALVATRLHFSVGFVPDTVRVSAATVDAAGISHTDTASVPVHVYTSPIVYHAPLSGQWLMQALPSVQSHHRFNPSTEFAVDFFKLGPDGHVVQGDPLDPKNFPGFGAPVMAAAGGTVEAVISDQVQDRPALLRKPGETADDFGNRVGAYHMATMARNFRAANAGNLVTIRHELGGVVEYSSYGHLRSGSVRVRPGDTVKQGDVIGEVGDTGDSAEVHLHFQINAGPDPFTAKSLPANFADLSGVEGNQEPGLLVTTAPQQLSF